MREANREVLRRNIEDLWGGGDAELIAQLYAPDVTDQLPVPGQAGGHDGLRDVLRVFRDAFPDLRMQLHGVLAEGDRAVDFWTFRGTHHGELMGVPATGRTVEFSGIDVARLVDGRVTQLWHVEEMLRLRDQLTDGDPTIGVVPWTREPAEPDDPEQHRALLRRMIEDVFATGDDRLLPEVFAPDVVDHQPGPGQSPGVDGIAELLRAFHAGFPDQRMMLHGVVVDGDLAADWWTFEGTHTGEVMGIPATGRRVEFHGCDVARIRDGRVTDIWHAEELLQLRDQLTGASVTS